MVRRLTGFLLALFLGGVGLVALPNTAMAAGTEDNPIIVTDPAKVPTGAVAPWWVGVLGLATIVGGAVAFEVNRRRKGLTNN